MKRKEFLKICGGSCMGFMTLPVLLQGCSSGLYYVDGKVINDRILVNKSDFSIGDEFREHIIVKFASSAFPIILYRFSESEYSALLLQCSHQGTELSVNGDMLTCSGHGSEFNNRGDVLTGPANMPLISFPVTTDDKHVYIQLD